MFWPLRFLKMKDYIEPKTRVEKKGRRSQKSGPYSAKHVRLAAAAKRRQAGKI